jgi:hypothetical protein
MCDNLHRSHMRFGMLVLAFALQVPLLAQPVISGVVNAFSGDSSAAPGTLISIYGSNLTNATQSIDLGARIFKAQRLGDPGTTHVFALSDLANLTRIYANWFNISISDAQSQFRGSESIAKSGPGVIFLASTLIPQNSGDYLAVKICVHELFHVLQNRLAGVDGVIGPRADSQVPVGGPRWLIEGSAEYMGYRAIGDAGLYPFAQAFGDQLSQARTETVTLESLETLPGINAAGPNGAYPLRFIAVDFVTQKRGLAALAQFWRTIGTGVSWQDAFLGSFGESISQFYSDFANYRASVLPPLAVLSGRVVDVGGRPSPSTLALTILLVVVTEAIESVYRTIPTRCPMAEVQMARSRTDSIVARGSLPILQKLLLSKWREEI